MKPDTSLLAGTALAEPARWIEQEDVFKEFIPLRIEPGQYWLETNGIRIVLALTPIPDGLLMEEDLLAIPVTDKEEEALELANLHPLALKTPTTPLQLRLLLQSAITHVEMRQELDNLSLMAQQYRKEIDELQNIGVALSSEHDIQQLLSLILHKTRDLVNADAGSLYVVEEVGGEEGETEEGEPRKRQLRFLASQNDSLDIPFAEFVMPITKTSIAGYVAATGETLNLADVYHLPEDSKVGFNRSFDDGVGYRSMSMLTVPMKDRDEETIGVLQLINRKREGVGKLEGREHTEANVVPFDAMAQNLIEAAASQAAVALTNATLYDEIQTLFEGFVHASVMAIESRDPTTSGHSNRVALLTTGLGEVVERSDEAPFRDITFSRDEMKELEYASLLHDFGKVGVREQVLVKANKLDGLEFERVIDRFHFIKKSMEANFLQQKVETAISHDKEEAIRLFREIDAQMGEKLEELDEYLRVVSEANRPTVLPEGNFEIIQKIANLTYEDIEGQTQPYLQGREAENLSIFKGSLNIDERQEIESHVVHTFKFLEKIPWSKAYKRIPEIAGKHHEKMDGKGYPHNIGSTSIPIQTRMMTISDIFDALTASDRPYKKAVPWQKALDILQFEVNDGKIDPQLYGLFVAAKVYERSLGQ